MNLKKENKLQVSNFLTYTRIDYAIAKEKLEIHICSKENTIDEGKQTIYEAWFLLSTAYCSTTTNNLLTLNATKRTKLYV